MTADDDARPCMANGCDWPGRFILGIDQGTTTCWCVRHVQPLGVAWIIDLVDGVRGALPPGWMEAAPNAQW
jgi:hypothetical protein